MIILKHGNYIVKDLALTDEDGMPILNLSNAIAIKFMVKLNREDLDSEALMSKNLIDGIEINVPVMGSLRLTIESGDFSMVTPGVVYHCAIQIEWSTDIKDEVDLSYNDIISDEIKFLQDVIR